MKHKLAGLLVFAALFCGWAQAGLARCDSHVPQPKPQNASRDIVGQDLEAIIERGFITFAAYEDFAPWSYEEAGKIKGQTSIWAG